MLGNGHAADATVDAGTVLRLQREAAESRIADRDDQIADLRRRLDKESEERRQAQAQLAAAQAQITALLTDQRPPPASASAREPPRSTWRRFWRRRPA